MRYSPIIRWNADDAEAKQCGRDSPPDAAKEHFCYGCKRFGQSCVRPCYRDVKRMEAAPCAL